MIQDLTLSDPFGNPNNDTERIQQKMVFIVLRCRHLETNSCSVTLTLIPLCLCRCTTGSGTLNAFTEWQWKNCPTTASAHQRNGRLLPSSTFLHPFIRRLKRECSFRRRSRAALRRYLCCDRHTAKCLREGTATESRPGRAPSTVPLCALQVLI